MKRSTTLNKHINPSIKEGDSVKIWDGSSLCLVDENLLKDISVFIVLPCHHLFNSHEKVKDLTFKVVKTGIDNIVSVPTYGDNSRLLDVVIEYNNVQLRTCSKFLNKI